MTGGWREDENRNAYFLTEEELEEFDEADQTIDNDGEFWTWFAEFREKHGIKKKRGRLWDEIGSGVSKTKSYLSDWWKGYGWSSSNYGGAGASYLSGDTRRLAMATEAVATTVRVVNETGKRAIVALASNDEPSSPTNVTDLDSLKIVVSPVALLDTKLDVDEAIEITTGWGCHEASHVQYTSDVYEELRSPVMYPMVVSGMAANVLEDDRIEHLTSEKFPGFSSYFDKSHDYLWTIQEPHVPKAWAATDLQSKIGVVVLSARWPTEYEAFVDAEPRLREVFDFVQGWRDEYLDGDIGLRDSVQKLLDFLKEDPETASQIANQEEEEKQQVGGGQGRTMTDEEFERFLDHFRRQLEANSTDVPIRSCQSQGEKVVLTDKQAQDLEKFLHEEVRIENPPMSFPDAWNGEEPPIMWIKPEEDEFSRSLYQKPTPLVNRLRGAFFFRKPLPQYSERLLKSGMVDDDELWRVGATDFNVFERRVIAAQPDTQVTMLIDSSGSMWGEGMTNAQMLCNTMLECLRTMKGVRVRIRSHSNDDFIEAAHLKHYAIVDRLWEPGDPVTRIGLLQSDSVPHNSNWDGYAVMACAEEMLRERRDSEDMVLFVLSDGLPNGRGGYSGRPAMHHLRRVTDTYIGKGVTIIQIAVGRDIRPQDQAMMYRYWIGYESEAKLPVQMKDLLVKLFGGA